MNDGEFQKFCYEEYKRSHSSVEDIYRRYPFALTVIVVLTTATIAVGSNDYWGTFFVRVDTTIYYLALIGGLTSLGVAAICLMTSALPKDYEDLGAVRDYVRWRTEYRAELTTAGQFTADEIDAAVEKHSGLAIMERLAEATDWNSKTARSRMRLYNRSVYAVSVAACCLAVAAMSSWLLGFRDNARTIPIKSASALTATAAERTGSD